MTCHMSLLKLFGEIRNKKYLYPILVHLSESIIKSMRYITLELHLNEF